MPKQKTKGGTDKKKLCDNKSPAITEPIGKSSGGDIEKEGCDTSNACVKSYLGGCRIRQSEIVYRQNRDEIPSSGEEYVKIGFESPVQAGCNHFIEHEGKYRK